MNVAIPEEIWDRLSCPHCGEGIEFVENAYYCRARDITFPRRPNGGLDLRLQRTKKVRQDISVGRESSAPPPPLVRFNGNKQKRGGEILPRLPVELLAYFPKPIGSPPIMLDLGCGRMIHRELCEAQGFRYVGLDYSEPDAMFLGDAQALPFKNDTFQFVLSIGAMPEVEHPQLMIQEAFRVLAPGGAFVGSVCYLESPGTARFHFTHLGLNSLLYEGGFIVDAIIPNHRWTVPKSLLKSALFPSVPQPVAVAMISPLVAAHRIWWWVGRLIHPKATEINRLLLSTGAFYFVAHKPDVGDEHGARA
jgi:SAM-dependent methyltransferase